MYVWFPRSAAATSAAPVVPSRAASAVCRVESRVYRVDWAVWAGSKAAWAAFQADLDSSAGLRASAAFRRRIRFPRRLARRRLQWLNRQRRGFPIGGGLAVFRTAAASVDFKAVSAFKAALASAAWASVKAWASTAALGFKKARTGGNGENGAGILCFLPLPPVQLSGTPILHQCHRQLSFSQRNHRKRFL